VSSMYRVRRSLLPPVLLISFCVVSGLLGWHAGAEEFLKVVIEDVSVEGNTVLSPEELEEFVEQYRGISMSFEDAEAMRMALQKRYERRGYVTTRVLLPPQEIFDSRISLKVVEGKIGAVKFAREGEAYFSDIDKELSVLHAGRRRGPRRMPRRGQGARDVAAHRLARGARR